MNKKTTAKGTAADKQIRELDTDALMRMDVGRFCVLREGANPEQRKRLDYLLDRAHLKNTIRTIVREELAAAKDQAVKGGRGWITEDPAMIRAYKRAAKRGPESIARFTAKMFQAEKAGGEAMTQEKAGTIIGPDCDSRCMGRF